MKLNALWTTRSLSYSFPYAVSTIYSAVSQLSLAHSSNPQQPAMLRVPVGWGFVFIPKSTSQGQALVSICSAANVAWYGMHFDSCTWRLQGLLRTPPRAPLRSAARCTDPYSRVPCGQGAGGAHFHPPSIGPRKVRRQERMESSSSWQFWQPRASQAQTTSTNGDKKAKPHKLDFWKALAPPL